MTQPQPIKHPSIIPPPPSRLLRLARANFYDLRLLLWESRFVLGGFVVLVGVGVLYLRYSSYNLRFVAALYETLKMLALQGSLPLPPSSDVFGEVLFFVLPLLGLALVFQSVLNVGRLLLDKGSRREAWQVALASTYHDHIIVCGLGRIGLGVVQQLLAIGAEVIVVERDWDSEFVERVLHMRVPVVQGDARDPVTLAQAGLLKARALITDINDDLLNVEVALTARKVRPAIRVVLRVFNEELDRNLERGLGPNSAFSASALAAPTYAAAAVSREVDYVLPVGGTLLGVAHLTIQHDSQMSGFIRQIEEQQGIRLLHHQDADGRTLQRAALRQLSGGETVTLFGTLPALETLRLRNARGSKLNVMQAIPLQHPTAQFNTVIVCGLGKVGYRVVQQLHRLTPRPRIVVVRLGDAENEFPQRISHLDGVETILGDARDLDVLQAAGIGEAYTVAALTSNDLLNLQIGLAARNERLMSTSCCASSATRWPRS